LFTKNVNKDTYKINLFKFLGKIDGCIAVIEYSSFTVSDIVTVDDDYNDKLSTMFKKSYKNSDIMFKDLNSINIFNY
jgi:hypothetical protein